MTCDLSTHCFAAAIIASVNKSWYGLADFWMFGNTVTIGLGAAVGVCTGGCTLVDCGLCGVGSVLTSGDCIGAPAGTGLGFEGGMVDCWFGMVTCCTGV